MKSFVTTLCLALAACRSVAPSAGVTMASGAGVVGPGSATAIATSERTARAFTAGDVEFMTGMIPHHAQAIVMAGWAASHGARADIRLFAEKIVVSQRDEIHMMRGWLAERGETVPDSTATRHMMKMDGMMHAMLMPGMLSDEEMAALDKARGSVFDRLFLTGMIRHHQGAINMVHELFSKSGAGQEQTVFRFASDVEADQAAEIQRMQIMLETVPLNPTGRE